MLPRELVAKVVNGEKTDRIPVGELVVSSQMAKNAGYSKIDLYRHLGLDIVVLQPKAPTSMATGLCMGDKEISMDCWGRKFVMYDDSPFYCEPALEINQTIGDICFPKLEDYDFNEVNQWHSESDLYVIGLVSGGYQEVSFHLGFEPMMVASRTNSEKLGLFIEAMFAHNLRLAEEMIKQGANAIIIADDIAFSHGTYISPHVLQFMYYPHLKRTVEAIRNLGVPVFFHSDGKLNQVLGQLVESGIVGVQCLEEIGGMNLLSIAKEFPELILWGNLDLGLVLTKDLTAIQNKWSNEGEFLKQRGRYIFGTSSGLSKDVDIEFMKEIYSMVR